MQALFRAIGRLSNSSATVLITGESGSGKELVARALHRHSPQRDQAFVAINTAAIPHDLLESELFGHERGAFTGAAQARRGRFAEAEGGTLFLDEIGDMPAELQTRLLRVLSNGEYYRVGGHAPQQADVRIIAATHQDLGARVRQQQFREDLFHRLNVIRIHLPALRDRREDIPMLVEHFLQKSASELQVEAKRVLPGMLTYLSTLDFPGNVRQLENLCHWLTVMAPGQSIEMADLPPEFTCGLAEPAFANGHSSAGTNSSWQEGFALAARRLIAANDHEAHSVLIQACERILISEALAAHQGRRIDAARALGIGRNTISRKIQELGLDVKPDSEQE